MDLGRLFLAISILLFIRCSTSDTQGDMGRDPDLESTEAQARIEATNEFALNFFKEIAENEEEENYMVSPLSLALALGMTYNGADGTTAEAFGDVLGYTDVNAANQFNQKLMKSLTASGSGATFNLANAIWIKDGFPVEADFVEVNQSYYDAEVDNLNFGDPSSVEVVNNWAYEHTRGKIDEFIKEFSGNTVLFLANALYFKGTWKYRFDEADTKDDTFYALGATEQVPMMHMSAEVPFYASDLFSSIVLPYKNDRYQMMVLLPNEGMDTNSIVSQLSTENLDSWLNGYSETQLNIKLPKFTSEYENLLNDVLTNMGLGVAFSGGADFGKINANASLQISRVLQKTFIEVNEEGTEAAAVTAVEIVETSAGPGRFFVANRPFLYLIRDSYTGSVCFIGRLGKP